ncbi:PH domain-containing protein DDB_G0275795-like [Armigeres subalbatus]|uniref:PH domain-containing protein DDB_G0275795-like n=1 Tax=Armigeres subalbatus TaxID=124917 RepID=UPI002ED215E1
MNGVSRTSPCKTIVSAAPIPEAAIYKTNIVSKTSVKRTTEMIKRPERRSKSNNKLNDKQLLLMAKSQFSGPPITTEHPIAALSAPSAKSFIHFKKGEIIYPAEKSQMKHQPPYANTQQNQQQRQQQQQQHQQQQLQQQEQPPNPDGQFELNPMRPPIVRLTQQSTEGTGGS